jgi:hypothetical protein
VSYLKAVANVERWIGYRIEQPHAREIAEDLIREALSERQRERLQKQQGPAEKARP